jgi:hypothetical protein
MILAAARSQAASTGWDAFTSWAESPAGVVIIGLLAILIGIGCFLQSPYFRNKDQRKPRWYVTTNTLLRDRKETLPDLKVSFQDRENIDTISVSVITFWNAGGESITREQVAKKDLFTVNAGRPGVEILAATALGASNQQVEFLAYPKDPGEGIEIDFDHLKENEGGVVQVVHTGGDNHALIMSGSLREKGDALHRVLDQQDIYTSRLVLLLVGAALVAEVIVALLKGVHGDLVFVTASTTTFIILVFLAFLAWQSRFRPKDQFFLVGLFLRTFIKYHVPRHLLNPAALPYMLTDEVSEVAIADIRDIATFWIEQEPAWEKVQRSLSNSIFDVAARRVAEKRKQDAAASDEE